MPTPIQADNRKLRHAMTVETLMEMLADCDPKALVFYKVDYGDHGHTMQALPVCEMVSDAFMIDEEVIVPSAYSQSGLAFSDVGGDDVVDENNFKAVVLRQHSN